MKFLDRLKQYKFGVFLALVLLISIGITIGGMIIYRTSGAYKYDLSRPGYEDIRGDVDNKTDESAPYSTNGPIDKDALKDFFDRYDKITDRLNEMNNYGSEVLSDENLNFQTREFIPEETVVGEILESTP
ncbi:hypothetical protein FWF74_01180 [Candidatus Saccharibacteria bacterium]|nr:hypothetical protein [Candidatus Saccharibacteria bacterium]MCL1963208.1 hypothetical protein [Candidatus Saccharibacteria bacterium]